MHARSRGVRRPEADRVDAHAPLDRVRHGVERLDPPRVPAVGEQHDDVRHVVVRSRPRRCRARCRRRGRRRRVWTAGLTSAIASSPFSIAAPIAVPRPVVTESIVSMSFVRSVVGGTASSANPEKMTSPIRTSSGWSSTNARVASWATASRFGLTSVAHIEPETSSARMIDVRAYRDVTLDVRPAGGHAERDEAREQQGDRKVALPPRAPRQHRAQQRDAGVADGLSCAVAGAATSRGRRAAARRAGRGARAARRTTAQITRPNQAIERNDPSASSSPPPAARSAVTSCSALDAGELEIDRLVDPLERRGVAGEVVRAVGHLRDLGQQLLVERGRDAEPVDLDHRPLRRPDPDRMDADARRGRDLGDLQRIGLGRVLAVREEHDRGRAVEPDVDLAAVALERGLVDLQRLPGDRAERREEALTERGAAARREASDRGDHLLLDVGRPEHGDGAFAERDHADADRARLTLRERRRRRLRGLDAGSARDPRRACCWRRRRRGSPCPLAAAGRDSSSAGRAPTQTTASAAAKSANGTCRRHRRPRRPPRSARAPPTASRSARRARRRTSRV